MADTEKSRKLLGARLAMARQQAGLSQGQVAKLLKWHRPTISEIEAGRRRVAVDELQRFAEIYDVSAEWLTGTDDKNATEDQARIELAARELAKLKKEDLQTVLDLLKGLRGEGTAS